MCIQMSYLIRFQSWWHPSIFFKSTSRIIIWMGQCLSCRWVRGCLASIWCVCRVGHTTFIVNIITSTSHLTWSCCVYWAVQLISIWLILLLSSRGCRSCHDSWCGSCQRVRSAGQAIEWWIVVFFGTLAILAHLPKMNKNDTINKQLINPISHELWKDVITRAGAIMARMDSSHPEAV